MGARPRPPGGFPPPLLDRVPVPLMQLKFGAPSFIRSRDIDKFTKYAESAYLTPLGKFAIAGEPLVRI